MAHLHQGRRQPETGAWQDLATCATTAAAACLRCSVPLEFNCSRWERTDYYQRNPSSILMFIFYVQMEMSLSISVNFFCLWKIRSYKSFQDSSPKVTKCTNSENLLLFKEKKEYNSKQKKKKTGKNLTIFFLLFPQICYYSPWLLLSKFF